ncbi:hypothetical protein JRO89_XS10G0059600 [Xanthoceras sorbifolium]|uniref:Uncharacterized protein n=1 Tax=Xanthoceras sorbifolium TaxID=99658 RepID=A0ABQ8HHX4_9ROSI|nr:hypothetical protein JRO89_XS10G0059600 [Xanthoceras sorbifolium]
MCILCFNMSAKYHPGHCFKQEWWEETDKKFQAWPRVAGPPVVMNPISRQNLLSSPAPKHEIVDVFSLIGLAVSH